MFACFLKKLKIIFFSLHISFFIPSSLPSCQISSPIEPEQQKCGKQVLSYQSQSRQGQERTGLNRREQIPCQPLIYIQYTLHPITFAQQLYSQPSLTTADVRREGGAPPMPHHPVSSYHRAMLLDCPGLPCATYKVTPQSCISLRSMC